MAHWAFDSIFYHVYPLGLCGAPDANDFTAAPQPRLEALLPWLEHARSLGANALYLGPVFESTSHGYDTADYLAVDRRLGTNATLAAVCARARELGLRVILDAVLNHVGRDFWAFRDLREKGRGSAYAGWFHGVDFGKASPLGDPFSYEGWNGHFNLVKLEVRAPEVRDHLFTAVGRWMEEYQIDGLRLDAADCLDLDFLRRLSAFTKARRPDFWLMGEIIHGDYARWANPATLDSVTNYECYKGLWSSHADQNYFEIAWSLNRQFGPSGLYRGLPLYAFADNHDVSRVASSLKDPAHLLPLYALLFTMPGVPSLYYGSEWGLEAVKDHDDRKLRPRLDLASVAASSPRPALAAAIARLAAIRAATPALRHGDYEQLLVASRQFAFARRLGDDAAITAVNADHAPAALRLPVAGVRDGELTDLLSPSDRFTVAGGFCQVTVPGCGACILAREPSR
jgi:cyclomaltodextrinase / maltogenic alpha-amylase / neopullulanase